MAAVLFLLPLTRTQKVMDLYDDPVPGARGVQNREYVESKSIIRLANLN